MGCEKDTKLLPPKMEDKSSNAINESGSWIAFEQDSSVTMNNMTTGNVTKVEIPDASHAIPSKNKDLWEKDISNFYTDKNVTECELPELIVCYREPTYHVVKDICVDEGAPSKEKVMVENTIGDKTSELSKEKVGMGITIPDGVKSKEEKNYKEECGDYEESIHANEGNSEGRKEAANGLAKEKILPEIMPTVGELRTENSIPELPNFDGNKRGQRSDLTLDGAAISSISPSKESKDNGIVGELSSHSNAESGSPREKIPKNCDHEHPREAEKAPRIENGRKSFHDGPTFAPQAHHGPGDANSSTAGPLSGLITYSGPIANSGSLSLRSDSSTTSTRSFAFPILQSEWNSSPVRMAKADRKQFKKQKRWRQGFFCCRF